MLNYLLSGSTDITTLLLVALSSLFIIFVALPIHECAHAFTANRLGDPTGRHMGRLTINPMAHIDWLGAGLLLLFGFGWAKPVPVNGRNFRYPKRDMAITAAAGPVTNLLVSAVLFLCANAIFYLVPLSQFTFDVYLFFATAGQINLFLAVFNLLPVPPLDGYRILGALLPNRLYYKFMQYEQYFYYILLALMLIGVAGRVVSAIEAPVSGWLINLTALPFKLVTGRSSGWIS